MLLQKAVHDPLQKILTSSNMKAVVEVARFKADEGVHDSSNEYDSKNVTYGGGCEVTLSDFVKLHSILMK